MVALGFVGFGEAAFNLAAGLRQEGFERLYAIDVVLLEEKETPAYHQARERLAQTGVRVCHSAAELASAADIVVLSVPAQHAEAAGQGLIEELESGQLLVDVTTAAPGVKRSLGEQCADKGVLYVDSPMLGPLIVDRHRVPMLACGPGAQRWREEMTPYGMNIEQVDGEPGSATQIKLARSVFTKGFEALLVETFLYARRCGIESLVMESIGQTLDGKSFEQSALRYMASNLFHAARKAHEMKDATAIMEELGVTPLVGGGAAARLQFIAELDCRRQLEGASPQSLEEICQAWEACGAL